MKALGCRGARRRLHALHDGELPVGDQIAVEAHVKWCGECAAALAELRVLSAAVRSTVPGRVALSSDEAVGFETSVVSRAKVERDRSLGVRLRVMFEDSHLIYAGLGASAATLASVIIMLGMMRFASIERPGSLADIVNTLPAPASLADAPVSIDGRVQLPRVLDAAFSAGSPASRLDAEDAVFTLAAVVTREGRVANLELLRSAGGQPVAGEAEFVEALLDAVSRARFEPAQVAGQPVAVNMVWLVARTTVRAARHPL